ncbi:hypothetical protein GWK47_053272 [Chionoecetes opilio]|uniref:Ig-like domain-containing protein n=1 Tax=Chionoecetes opilio TaxID=41210 RepID=A0A8J5CRC6_CHIOP|nr:hypothetical protein GWK47_053272 [Chionoecetes opilio]
MSYNTLSNDLDCIKSGVWVNIAFMYAKRSYDTRSSSFKKGERWTAEGYFGSRAFFRIMSDPPTLVVEGVQVADEAVYTCRVDYKVRPSAITKVNLTVIVPPGPPTIVHNNNNIREQGMSAVGPLEEGVHTELTCRSAEGSPTPTLTWWRDGERLDQVLRPLSVRIVGEVGTLSAGRPVELVCRAVGSRPPARITFWRGAHNITDVTRTVGVHNGNERRQRHHGSVIFRPTRHDDGRHVRCTAVNPTLVHAVVEDSVMLSVRCEY